MNYGSGRRAVEMIDTEFLAIFQARRDLGALGTGTELLCPTAPGGLSWFNPGQLLLRVMLCLNHKVLSYEGPWRHKSTSEGEFKVKAKAAPHHSDT